MSSFVAEVLSSAGQMEREEINEKLSMLGRRMEELKMEIHAATTATGTTTFSSDFEPSFDATATLSDKVKAVSEEMQELTHKVETEVKGQLKISTGEFQALSRQHDQVTMVMGVLEKLSQAQGLMDHITTATSQGKFSQASASLALLEGAMKQPVCQREQEIKILGSVRIQVGVLKQQLIQDLNDSWKDTVSWNTPTTTTITNADSSPRERGGEGAANKPESEEALRRELKLPRSDSTEEQERLSEMVSALDDLGELDRKLQGLGRHLATNVFPLTLAWTKVSVTETPLASGKQVVVKAGGECGVAQCVDVFSTVGALLDLLHDSVLHLEVTRKVQGEGVRVTLMSLLGEQIGEKVVDSIVKECLSHAIPSTAQELDTFHEVIAVTKMFQDKLVALGFLQSACRGLQDYVENVNVLFANKKCQSILERARNLMTSDIHDTVLISADASPGELPPLDKAGGPSKEKSRKVDMNSDPLLKESAFRLPTCRINANIQELLDLAYSTLREASTSSPQCATQMFYAVRNIFELFCSVFPTYHAHSLANFPQLAALHHNNCMFLAHHLLTLGHQFRPTLPPDVSATFVDLVQDVRSMGSACFLEQISTQKNVLEQYIQGAQGFSAVDEDSNFEAAERSLKQALHQLSHLQRVWQDVLPATVYRKAIGVLLSSLLTHIMDHLTSLEDISSEAARKLFLLLKTVDDKAALLFTAPDKKEIDADPADLSKVASGKAKVDLVRYTAKYGKFRETQLVLNGSLQEICDRWAEGMGPLAEAFPPNELKQMIRALFQNTDRRAAVLAKIK